MIAWMADRPRPVHTGTGGLPAWLCVALFVGALACLGWLAWNTHRRGR